jgi:hypothetical protein
VIDVTCRKLLIIFRARGVFMSPVRSVLTHHYELIETDCLQQCMCRRLRNEHITMH